MLPSRSGFHVWAKATCHATSDHLTGSATNHDEMGDMARAVASASATR